MNWLKTLTDSFLPLGIRRDAESYRKASLLIHSGFIILAVIAVYLPIYYIISYTWGVVICLVGGFSILILLYSSKFNPNLLIISNLAFLIANAFFLSFCLTSGGISSPLSAWLISIPLIAFLVLGKVGGYVWVGVCALQITALFILQLSDLRFPVLYDDKWQDVVHFVDFLGLALFMMAVILVYLNGRELALEQLQRANDEISAKNEELKKQQAIIEKINLETKVKNNLLEVQHDEIKLMNRKLEDMVNERTERLVKANEELDLFLYRASHDLRRPVTSLIGLFELARLEFGKPAGYELFNHMNTTAGNMDKMLRKLIMISEVNHEYTHPSEIDLSEIVDKILRQFRKTIQENNFEISVDIDTQTEFYSIPILLEIILFNLIENSLAFYNDLADETPKIAIRLHSFGNKFEIEVKDNGVGIPEEHIGKVLKMFYRGTLHSQGNGLGLYIVKKAVERLEGHIDIRSQENQGSTVKVILPIKSIKNLNLNVIL
jgi:signal transduction histidine kinase